MAHSKADREHEEGVEAHTRGKGERLLGVEGHDQGTDDGCESGGCEDRSAGHVEGTEDAGVDGQDVGHREERSETCENLGTYVVLRTIEAEEFLKERFHNDLRLRRSTWYRCKGGT